MQDRVSALRPPSLVCISNSRVAPVTPTVGLDWRPQCGRIPEVCSYPQHFPGDRCGIATAALDAPKYRRSPERGPKSCEVSVRPEWSGRRPYGWKAVVSTTRPSGEAAKADKIPPSRH